MAVATFRDRALLALGEPDAFGSLLSPDGQAIRTVLGATYDLPSLRIDRIDGVAVAGIELQHPIGVTGRRSGAWTQTVPAYTRTEFTVDTATAADVAWIDILARLRVTVVAEADPAGADAVTSRNAGSFTTVEQFRQQFPYVDVDAFMAGHGIETVEELRTRFDYVRTGVQLRTPGPFDPADPVNRRTLDVTVAAVTVDPLDLAQGLRAVRLVAERTRALGGASPDGIPAEDAAAYAPAVVFAAGGPAALGITTAAVEELFARAGVAALFLSTS